MFSLPEVNLAHGVWVSAWFGIQEEEHTEQNDFICIPPFLAYCILHTLVPKKIFHGFCHISLTQSLFFYSILSASNSFFYSSGSIYALFL
jgi:hypothetical protein